MHTRALQAMAVLSSVIATPHAFAEDEMAPERAERIVNDSDARAKDLLAVVESSGSYELRVRAAEEIGNKERISQGIARGLAEAAYEEARSNPRSKVAIAAIEALGELGPRAGAASEILVRFLVGPTYYEHDSQKIRGLYRYREIVKETLVKLGKPALRTLMREMRDPAFDPIKHHRLSFLVGRSFGRAARPVGPVLLRALKNQLSTNPEEVGLISGALGYLQYRPAVPVFVRMVKDEDGDLRREGAIALGRSGRVSRRALPVLLRIIEKRESHCGTALWAALQIAPKHRKVRAAHAQVEQEAEQRYRGAWKCMKGLVYRSAKDQEEN